MPASERRRQLASFLRARRAALTPRDVGLPPGGRRLVAGLRREEVALLAEVGLTWYTWLEQGRDIRISASVGRRISAALRLDASEEAYFQQLAGLSAPTPSPSAGIDAPLLRAALETYAAPACVLDPLLNLVAANRIMDHVYGAHGREDGLATNQLWQFFTNPARQALYACYDDAAPHIVRSFRLSSACRIGDPEYSGLVAQVQDLSPTFARLWSNASSEAASRPEIQMRHAECGGLSVRPMHLPLPDSAGATIVLLVAADEHTSRCFSGISREVGAPTAIGL